MHVSAEVLPPHIITELSNPRPNVSYYELTGAYTLKNQMLNRAFSNVLKKENANVALIMLKKWLGYVTHGECVDFTLS